LRESCLTKLRARCTSAAPSYFKKFIRPGHQANKPEEFEDGAIYFNNPAGIALEEAKSLSIHPGPVDILLSIGTGFDMRNKEDTRDVKFCTEQQAHVTDLELTLARLWDAILGSLDSEREWRDILSRTLGEYSTTEDRCRYRRLNLPVNGPLPDLADVQMLPTIRNNILEYISKSEEFSREANGICNKLRASLFHFDSQIWETSLDGTGFKCSGYILCRLQPNSNAMKAMLGVLEDPNTAFEIQENGQVTDSFRCGPCFVESLRCGKRFELPIRFDVGFKISNMCIYFCSNNGVRELISGFPRLLDPDYEHARPMQMAMDGM
jgi:hypothetical protein